MTEDFPRRLQKLREQQRKSRVELSGLCGRSLYKEGGKPLRGKVVYVHAKGRFHVVEFGEGCQASGKA